MLARSFFIATLVAALLAAPGAAQGARQLLMPGVTYEREVVFAAHGPVAVHVLTAPKPGGLWSLEPALSNGAIVGREPLTAIARAHAREATVAGVNGDFFAADGAPHGLLVRGGVLEHEPRGDRSSVGVGADGTLRVDRVRVFGRWWGTGQRRPLDLNRVPSANGVALFTPAWGPTTPPGAGVVEAVLAPFPPTRTNGEIAGTVASIAQTSGATPIPRDGAVLVARGTGAGFLAGEAPLGTTVNVRLLLSPDWADVPWALGGGPVLVRDGKPVFRSGETFGASLLARNPRAAVGQLADGRVLLVSVDGGQPGYSAGMTSFELGQTLTRLGAVTAAGLGVGPAAGMVFEGELLSRPSARGVETPVSDALLVAYRGVYVAPPLEAVLSPNGDRVAESQTLTFKLPRRATVTSVLLGPDRVARTLESRERDPGTYRYTWQGRMASGQTEPEGVWRFRVTAVEPAGTSTTAERAFVLNRTLGGLAVNRGRRSARATFVLTRPAKVTGVVQTRAGVVVAVVGGKTLRAGRRTLVWNGRLGRKAAHRGAYVFRVAATNRLGRAELERAFVLG